MPIICIQGTKGIGSKMYGEGNRLPRRVRFSVDIFSVMRKVSGPIKYSAVAAVDELYTEEVKELTDVEFEEVSLIVGMYPNVLGT